VTGIAKSNVYSIISDLKCPYSVWSLGSKNSEENYGE
jgi:hypothetical protein